MTDPLVLIPGFANNEQAWQHQIEALSDLCDVHVYIMDKETTRDEMVLTLLQEAPDRFILAGHSMGGWIAQAVAAQAPERVSKLLLLNTWATSDPKMQSMQKQISESLKLDQLQETMQQQLPLLVHPSRSQDLPLFEGFRSMIAHFPIDVLIQQLEAILDDYSSLHHHSAIICPTLIIHSSQDALFPLEYQSLLDGIKHSQLAVIEGCGHASIVEQPEAVTHLMRSFIEA